MTFNDLKLSNTLLNTLIELGYKEPSPIQSQAIPSVLKGRDLIAAAQTGTGKTASFALPILDKLSSTQRRANSTKALILTPTRELAAQVHQQFLNYGANLDVTSMVVFGGVKINPQMMKLRKGTHVLVATPGRLLDLVNQNAVKLNQLELLVLDEADRMLDMGFIHDIKKIIKLLPNQRQTLLFSATLSKEIKTLAKGLLKDPLEISIKPKQTTAVSVGQVLYAVDKKKKADLLMELINQNKWQQVLVFTKTKHGANRLVKTLASFGFSCAPIHGNKSQAARTKALEGFKQGNIDILVATDIAARGLDIQGLPQVVNFELPQVAEDYVHRIGRTGRAGKKGRAYSLVSADECDLLFNIERLIKKTIPREYIENFIPSHDLPEKGSSKGYSSYKRQESSHQKRKKTK